MTLPTVHLGAAGAAGLVELRNMAALSAPGVTVDEEKGILRNVSFMTAGDAAGHGFEIDDVMLRQIADAINAGGGAKSRLGHPELIPDGVGDFIRADAIGKTVGRALNARVEGGQLRGDVQLGDYAEHLPGAGNARKYLLGIAKQHPTQIGLSVVFRAAPYEQRQDGAGNAMLPLGRSAGVDAVDFVDKPAANPAGLLSEPPNTQANTGHSTVAASATGTSPTPGGGPMDPKMKAYLVSLGLDPKATDGEAKAFLSALGRRKQVALAAAGHAEAFEKTMGRKPVLEVPADGDGNGTHLSQGQGAGNGSGGNGQANANANANANAGNGNGGNAAAANQAAADPGAIALAELQQRTGFLTQLAAAFKLGDDWQPAATVELAETPMADFYTAARKAAVKHLAEHRKPGRVEVRDDNAMTALHASIEDAVLLRVGTDLVKVDGRGQIELGADRAPVARQPHAQSNRFAGMSLVETGRHFLSAIGVKTEGLARGQVARLLFDKAAIARRTGDIALSLGVGDFPGLLAAVMNKSLRTAYQVAPVTWDQWCRRDTNPDFKPAYRLQLSETDIESVAPGQEYPEAPLSDSKETFTLGKFGRIISFNWETLVNDDLNAFGQVPRKMGQACKRKEDETAYAVLTGNQTMTEDATTLFHANHANDGGGASPTWYLAADPNMFETVVVAFLEGENGPVFEEENGFDSDKRKYKVRHVLVARALDYRGLVRSLQPITIANLDAARKLMRVQKDIAKKDFLDLNPQILIVNVANEITAKQLINSPVDPTKSNNTPNPFQGVFKIVATPRLP